mmetsp:Transcript_32657/g.90033  ORF Transcript_32657/g.90033 Transcript_32657/m.90033 type:complete len:354 (+) Transcript_32657:1407-2468(+)
MLGRLLNERHGLVALVLHHFIHQAKLFLLLADFLVFLFQVVFLQLLHRHLVRGLAAQPMRCRRLSGELLSLRRERLEVRVPSLLLHLQILEFFFHFVDVRANCVVLLLLFFLQSLLLEECPDEEVDLSLDVLEQLFLTRAVFLLLLQLLAHVLVLRLQRLQRLVDAVFLHLRFFVLAFQLFKLLLQLREIRKRVSGFCIQPLKLLVQTDALYHKLPVDVFFPVQTFLGVFARTVGDLRAFSDHLQPQMSFGTRVFNLLLLLCGVREGVLSFFDFKFLFLLLLEQGLHCVVELFRLLSDAIGVTLDLQKLLLMASEYFHVLLRLALYLLDPILEVLQLCLVRLFLGGHRLDLFC